MAERALKSVPPERGEAPEVREIPTAVPASRPSDVPSTPSRKKLRKLDRRGGIRWGLFAILPVVLIVGLYWYATGGKLMSTDDAYVDTQKVAISTDVAGIVQAVNVTDNERVAAGQVLYRLDPRQYQIALNNAKANLAQTALNIDAMRQDYKRMLSDVAAQQAQVVLDQTNYARDSVLLHSGTVSQAIFDQAQSTLDTDKSKLESLRQQAQVQLARLDGNADIPATQHPQYLQAEAQVEEAQRQLDHTAVAAPFAGRVTDVSAIAAREISRRLDNGVLSGRYRPRLDRGQSERDRAHLCAARPARYHHRRRLSRRDVARHGRKHQPGGGSGIFPAARAEHQRQLGKGRAARADAGARRCDRAEQAAAARRHERRGRCRHRSRARSAASFGW